MTNHRLITLLAIVFCCLSIFSQTKNSPKYTIKGIIVDMQGKTLPYATVSAEQTETQTQRRAASDGNGKFELNVPNNKSYSFSATYVGFETYKQTVSFKPENKVLDLGKIMLKDGVSLKEVEIKAQKVLVTSDVDKLTYNMEEDPESKGNNLLDMIRKVPMLSLDGEENVLLNGKTNYKVLMNGKTSSMLQSGNLRDILRSIPAHTIKNIEVITNPSSKYDAEGVEGIINIITVSKRGLNGVMGSVGASADSYGSLGLNAYVSSKVNKFAFSTRVSGNQYKRPGSSSKGTGYTYNDEQFYRTESSSENKNKSNGMNLGIEASYEIDTLNLITFSAWGYGNNNNGNGKSYSTTYSRLDEISRQFNTENNSQGSSGWYSGSLDYQKTFSKPDRSLTASYKFDFNPSSSDGQYDYNGVIGYDSYKQKNISKAISSEQTLQLDYYDPLSKKHVLEGGFKYILRTNNSTPTISEFNDSTDLWENQYNKTNNLQYDQHIFGLYAGYLFKLEKFSTKAGLRAEGTINKGYAENYDNSLNNGGLVRTPLENTIFNIVPYITLSYSLTKEQRINLGYTQRLYRPGIWYLNPYYNDTNPLYITQGNPNVAAEIAHNISAYYSWYTAKHSLSARLNYSTQRNGIEHVTEIKPGGITYTTYDNIAMNDNFSLNLYGNIRFSPKISLNANVTGNYSIHQSNNPANPYRSEGFSVYTNLGARFIPWKDGSINLNGYLSSPGVSFQYQAKTIRYGTWLSINQQFFNKKLNVGLSVNNPYPRYQINKSESFDNKYNPTWYNFNEYRYPQQRFSLNITYSFGKIDDGVKKARRSISNDDVKSGGGGGE